MRSSLPSSVRYEAIQTVSRLANYQPHPGQQALHACDARYRLANEGRKWGKSFAVPIEAVTAAIGTPADPNPLVWIVGPTYDATTEIYGNLRHLFLETPLASLLASPPSQNPMRFVLKHAGEIRCISGHEPDRARGPNVSFLVLEEAAQLSDYAVEAVFLPSLLARNGRMLAISTPKGRNWFYRWYMDGQDELKPEVASFHGTSYDNPYIPGGFIDEMRDRLSDSMFRQEIMAEFLVEEGAVFHGVMEQAIGALADPKPGRSYVIGVDWAKHQDFTVFTVMDVTARSVVAWERLTGLDYATKVERLVGLHERYNNAFVLMDASGVGDPILELLKRRIVRVDGYVFTYRSKRELINALVLAIERGEIVYPDIGQLINELLAYEIQKTTAGNIRYDAPKGEGYHDDCVMSLALANWARHKRFGGAGLTVVHDRLSGERQTRTASYL